MIRAVQVCWAFIDQLSFRNITAAYALRGTDVSIFGFLLVYCHRDCNELAGKDVRN